MTPKIPKKNKKRKKRGIFFYKREKITIVNTGNIYQGLPGSLHGVKGSGVAGSLAISAALFHCNPTSRERFLRERGESERERERLKIAGIKVRARDAGHSRGL